MGKIKIICLVLLLFFLIAILFLLVMFFTMGVSSNCNIQQSSEFYNQNTDISNIIITFTTMPDRLQSDLFQKMVSSALSQSVRPQEIRAHIPYKLKKTGKEYIIPDWLSATKVNIVRVEDHGPATKFLSAVKDYQSTNQRFLVCDDDIVLDTDAIKEFQLAANKYPNLAIAPFGTVFHRKIDPDSQQVKDVHFEEKTGLCQSYMGKGHHAFKLILPNHLQFVGEKSIKSVDLLYGCFTYSITANMVNYDELTDWKNMPKQAFFVDDVVLSAHLAKNRVPKVVLPNLPIQRLTYKSLAKAAVFELFKIGFDDEALSANTNTSNDNNNVVIKHFLDVWGTKPLSP